MPTWWFFMFNTGRVGGMAVAVSASTLLFLVEKLLDDLLNQANQSFFETI